MASGGLSNLVQQAEHLEASIGETAGLPRVHRSLAQILQQGEQLWMKTSRDPIEETNYKAAVLLGPKGYDVPRITQKLESLSAAKTFEPLEPVREVDIQGFLKNERENALLTVIEETRKSTFERAESRHWETLFGEWEREKQRVLNALVTPGDSSWDFLPQPESFLEQSTLGRGRTTMDEAEIAYAKEVYVYNERILEGGVKPKLVHMFKQAVDSLHDKELSDIWDVISLMSEVVPPSTGCTPEEHRMSTAFHASVVKQALKYLHTSYRRFMQNSVYSRLESAALGGVPGTLALVRSFLRLKIPNGMPGLELEASIDGQPVWAMLYFCLRCGDMSAALEVVTRAGAVLKEYDFDVIFREYATNPDNRLSQQTENRLQQLYRRVIHTRSDPFMRAVYCVVGRCGVEEEFSELWSATEDFLWMRLSQVTFIDAESEACLGADRLTLPALHNILVRKFGESHFTSGGDLWLWPRLLFLTAQQEVAIEFLSRSPQLRAHGLHAALAYHQLGLLLTPSSPLKPMLSRDMADEVSLRRLNLARLVTLYTKKFEVTDPREALNYLFFLNEMTDSNGENMFTRAVTELVLETREFEMLLGKVEANGTRRSGAVCRFTADIHRLIEMVARDTENKGLFLDAISLYDMAEKHDKCLSLLNSQLSLALSKGSSEAEKAQLLALASALAVRYRQEGVNVSSSVSSTFFLLMDLSTFFSQHQQRNLDTALHIIRDLKLLPVNQADVDAKVKSFSNYTDELRRCLPDVIIATMNILHDQYSALRASGVGNVTNLNRSLILSRSDTGSEAVINDVREQALALVTFVGMIPYRLPGDTSAKLVQLEQQMH